MEILRFLICLVLLSAGICAAASPGPHPLADAIVPIDTPSEKREAALRVMKTLLAGHTGQAAREPEFIVADSGRGLLWGDLFKTGGCFALVELAEQNDEDPEASGVAFAEWAGGAWQLRGLWDIPTIWRPAGWKNSDDYLPATPATQPFSLEDFSGDGTPEVLFAGGVWKYFQENILLRFIPQTKQLRLVAWAMARPEKVEEYVVLYTDSGRRAIWSQWQFCKWSGHELKPVASWHCEVGYNANDPTFAEGMRTSPDGAPTTIRLLYGHGSEYDAGDYNLSRNGRPFGTMNIVWNDPRNPHPDASQIQSAWLFEKTTGLPRRLFPERDAAKNLPKLEDIATITIERNAEAAAFFH